MHRCRISMSLFLCCGWAALSSTVLGLDKGYEELRGHWEVIELVDNGRVIPQQSIPGWLPSGGSLEIMDNTFIFLSRKDGARHARTFEIDATSFPKQLNLVTDGRIYGHGIYRVENGQLVVCISPPQEAPRPTDFSAPQGSRRVLMVMQRSNASQPDVSPRQTTTAPYPVPSQVVPSQPVVTTTIAVPTLPPPPDIRIQSGATEPMLTDAQVLNLLVGTWKLDDAYGPLYLSLDRNGTYRTYRETLNNSTFQKVFSSVPVSSGTWTLRNGQVVFHCTSSAQPERVNRDHPFQVRSVTPSDLIFVDYAGNVGKAVKLN